MRRMILLFFLLVAGSLYADNFYVTSAAEIAATMKSAQPGDTLIMRQGVWTDQQIKFEGNGEEGNPIVLIAEKPGFVVLNGFSSLRISGNYLEVNGLHFVGGYSRSGAPIEFRNGSSRLAHHCRLTNTAIIDYNPPSLSTDYKWVSIYGSYNRVDHCYFEGKRHSGTTLVVWLDGQPNYHRIDHNYFGERPELGYNGGETIRVGTSDWSMTDSYTTVEYNYFERCNGETEIISNKSCENIYRYNTFFDCEGVLTLRHGNRCTVEGNFFLGNNNYDAGGVRIIGEDHKVFNNYFYQLNGSGYRSALCMVLGVPNSPLNRYFQVKRALVAFNTFVDCRNTFNIGYGSSDDQSLPPVDCTIANNVAVSDDDLINYANEPVNLVYESNILWGDLGIDPTEGILQVDPQLTLVDDLWHLSESSPAVDAAVGDYAFVVDDMDGQPRTGLQDVGADELSDEPVVRGPIGPESTGPAWLADVELPTILTIQIKGEGEVAVDPPGGIYELGAEVTLTAIPDSGWKFVGWSGEVETTDNPITITMDESKTLKALFVVDAPAQFTVTIYVFSGGGHVDLQPAGPTFVEGSGVTLTAVPDEGWEFKGWGGDLSGGDNPATIIVDSDKSIMATFAKIPALVAGDMTPTDFALQQNYPNPFNPSTGITYALPRASYVLLVVYNSLGQRVATLADGLQPAGVHQVTWAARAEDGQNLKSGIYFCKLQAGEFTAVKKMTLVR